MPATMQDIPVTIGKMAKTGYNYLSRIAQKLQDNGVSATIAVLIGDVAEEIVRFAKEEKVDLVIMASRGRRSLKRWDVGNAAAKVFRALDIPIMMVRPAVGFKETKPVRKGKSL